MAKDVCCIVGMAFGSEGKGAVIPHIADEYAHHVRVGAANAGHTLYTFDPHTGDPEKHVMQQVPCAAYANTDAHLYIGPGALISPEIFMQELITLDAWRRARGLSAKKVFVDYRAHVITSEQIAREYGSDLAQRIGSTSATAAEGIGTAQADRVMREADCVTAITYMIGKRWRERVSLVDVPALLYSADGGVLLEGTQGTGLSLTTGFFPFTTSRNTTAAGLAAECGVAPTRIGRVIGVARSYPIRVAGNSGPFFEGSDEIQWSDIGINPENERTTVTKKIRRVATLSMKQLQEATYLNGVTEIALMFADYIDPKLANISCPEAKCHVLREKSPSVMDVVDYIEFATTAPVTFIGTGPHDMIEFI